MNDDEEEIVCPIDCLHTKQERERIRRRRKADGSRRGPDLDPDDPYVQKYGYPESYK